MSPIPAKSYPAWDDLGRAAQQRKSRSVDGKKAKTLGSRLIHFLGFVRLYRKFETYLTNNKEVTDEIMTRYVIFLIDGYTINGNPILVGTIRAYLEVVNKHYQTNGLARPFDHRSESDAATLLQEQEKFEKEPARRAPLNDKMRVKMYELSLENSRGFRAAAWDFTNLKKYGVFFVSKSLP